MNKTLLLIICDFLLLNLLALTRWEKAEPPAAVQPTSGVTAPAGGASKEDDMVALMRSSLEDERRERERVESELQARESRLGEREEALAKLQSERERLAGDLEQTRAGVGQLQAQVAEISQEARVSKSRLEAAQRELSEKEAAVKRREAELADLSKKQAEARERIESLSVAVKVAEQEKSLLKETADVLRQQVEVERVERAKVQETATQLAAGVGQLAQSSTDLTKEIRENRPLSANVLFNEFMANRVVVRMSVARPGPLGAITRASATDTVVVTDGKDTYALVHWDETPLGGREPAAEWTRMSFVVRRGGAEAAPGRVQQLKGDPRLVGLPVTEEERARLGVKSYVLANDPFKFGDTVLISKGGAGYGEVSFKLDPSQPGYVKMDNRLMKRLFGDFSPSRGDLVVSRTGELLGIMVTSDYCAVLGAFMPERTLTLGEKVEQAGNEAVIETVQRRIDDLPFRMR